MPAAIEGLETPVPAGNAFAGTGAPADGRADSLLGTVLRVLATGLCYYLATRAAWVLCFPDSKVSLFFPPHAILVAILLLVPTRHWWAYTLAAVCGHFLATQQEHWPPSLFAAM